MTAERTTLLVPPVEAIDRSLFAEYQAVQGAGNDTFSRLLPGAEKIAAEKERFFGSGCQTIPDLRPQSLDAEALIAEETELLDFKERLADFPLASIAQLYRWRVNEQIANTRMLQAIAGDDPKLFDRYNYFVYGMPRQEIFASAVDWVCADAEERLQDGNQSVREAAEPVLELMGDMRGDRQLILPSDETFQIVRKMHYRPGGFYALLLAGVELDPAAKVTRGNGDPALRQVLRNLESDYRLTPKSGAGWSVSAKAKEVRHPEKYNLSYIRWVGLPAGHEVGSHLLEAVNGNRSPIRLAGSGLDRADNGNEGRAVIREQVPYDSFDSFATTQRWQVILRRHIGTSLALGLADGNMDFPGVYPYINVVDTLYERRLKSDDIGTADAKARSRSWSLGQEIFKGTDGRSGPYRRDPLYLEGNARWWNLAREHPERIEHGNLCKADLTEPRHVERLELHNVIPSLSR